MHMSCKEYLFDDLGAVYSSDETGFRLWAPVADEVFLCLYKTGDGDDLIKRVRMEGNLAHEDERKRYQ